VKVLLVPATYYPKVGGVEEATRQLARELRRRGDVVEILTNRWRDSGASGFVEDVWVSRVGLPLPGATVGSRSRFILGGSRAAASVLSLVSRFRPDVVHLIAAGPSVAYFAALRRLIGIPLVLTSHGELGIASDRILYRSRALRWGLRRLLAGEADAVTACSRYVADELAAEFRSCVEVDVVPNGVDLEEFQVAPADEGRYLFAAGRLVEQKGFDLLLDALAQAGPELGGLDLVIAGTGRDGPRLKNLTRELGLEGRVRWLGVVARDRLVSLLKGAELVAVPSRAEPFGIIVLEAMAAGKPIVASRVGGIPEFADGTAFLVPPGDSVALASGLLRLARDEGLRALLGEAARRKAQNYSWRVIADRYRTVYRQVA
jgi:glycosyltransferase involved in cell wall biosynthesis